MTLRALPEYEDNSRIIAMPIRVPHIIIIERCWEIEDD